MSLAVIIVAGIVLIVLITQMTDTMNSRKVRRKELEGIQEDISQIKSDIGDMKEQLADIVIRLSD